MDPENDLLQDENTDVDIDNLSDEEVLAALGGDKSVLDGKQSMEEEQEPEDDSSKPVSYDEFTKLSNSLKEKEKFIGKQGTEIGDLRKKLNIVMDIINKKKEPAAEEPSDEEFALDPKNAVKKMLAQTKDTKDTQSQLDELDADEKQRQLEERYEENKSLVTGIIPDFDTHVDSLAELLTADQAPPEFIKAVKDKPYLIDPALLINMHKRAVAEKEVSSLKAEIEKLKGNSKKVLDGLKTKKASPTDGTPSAKTSKVTDKTTNLAALENMSPDELEQMIDKMSTDEVASLQKQLSARKGVRRVFN